MKILLLVLAALAPLSALANDELHCHDVRRGPDHGYLAVVKELRTAQLSEETIAGPRDLPYGSLECTIPHVICRGDRSCLVAVCTTPHVADVGYTLYVSRFQNAYSARLMENSFRGSREIASLACQP
ncbi:MAG: hypothetical protein ACXVB9_20015 [Bdellovibrionota bacterium]